MEQGTFTILLAGEEGRIDPSFLPFRSRFSHFPSPFFPPSFSFQKNARENSIFRYETIFYYTVVILNGDSRTTEAASTHLLLHLFSFLLFFLFSRIQSGAGISQICVAAIDQGKFIIIGGAIKPSICKTSMRDTRATCFSWR